MKTSLGLCLLMIAPAFAAAAATAPLLPVLSGTAPTALDDIVALNGGEPAQVTIRSAGTERVVSWDEFQAALRGTILGDGPQADGPIAMSKCTLVAGLDVYCGPDAGQGGGGSLYCDDSSAWVLYKGLAPGSAVTEATAVTPVSTQVCGGFYGPAFEWDSVALSSTANPEVAAAVAQGGYEGCFATTWTIHSDGFCPNSGGALDTFVHEWRGRGVGVLASFDFGGVSMDYFLGLGADAQYDLPVPSTDVGTPAVGDLGSVTGAAETWKDELGAGWRDIEGYIESYTGIPTGLCVPFLTDNGPEEWCPPHPYVPQANPGDPQCTGVGPLECHQPDNMGAVLIPGPEIGCNVGKSAIVAPTTFTLSGRTGDGHIAGTKWSIHDSSGEIASGKMIYHFTDASAGYYQTQEAYPSLATIAALEGGHCYKFNVSWKAGQGLLLWKP